MFCWFILQYYLIIVYIQIEYWVNDTTSDIRYASLTFGRKHISSIIKIIQGFFHTILLLQYIWIWHKKKWLRYIHSATTVFLSHNIVCITQHYSDWKSPFLHYPFLMFDGGYRFLPSPTQPSLIDKGET